MRDLSTSSPQEETGERQTLPFGLYLHNICTAATAIQTYVAQCENKSAGKQTLVFIVLIFADKTAFVCLGLHLSHTGRCVIVHHSQGLAWNRRERLERASWERLQWDCGK